MGSAGRLVMPADILQFVKDRSFDANATRALGEAYDKACQMLRERRQPPFGEEMIAKRIIQVASTGERNPDELARRALETLGFKGARP